MGCITHYWVVGWFPSYSLGWVNVLRSRRIVANAFVFITKSLEITKYHFFTIQYYCILSTETMHVEGFKLQDLMVLNGCITLLGQIRWDQSSSEESIREQRTRKIHGIYWRASRLFWLHWMQLFFYFWCWCRNCTEWKFCQTCFMVRLPNLVSFPLMPLSHLALPWITQTDQG